MLLNILKHKAKINLITNNDLNLEDYIEFKSKQKKYYIKLKK